MSYRSLKRVLGETSLERKCRFLFGACLLLLITGSFWWYGNQTEHAVVYTQNRRNARALVESVTYNIHYSQEARPKKSKDFAEQYSKEFQDQEYKWKVIRPSSNDGTHRPEDDFEAQLLQKWNNNIPAAQLLTAPVEFADRISDGGGEEARYFYYQAVRLKTKTCVSCHNKNPTESTDLISRAGPTTDANAEQGLAKMGDLAGIVRISLPNQETQTALNRNRAILLATAIITVFLAMIALYVIVRYVIVKPLTHLREVSDEVSRGNIDLRADIHTGDEFEELAAAFNRMLRNLATAQNELRDVNTDLDSKVDQLAQANMKLHELNRLRSDFLATMSHELRTPLNSIIGFSDVLSGIDSLNEKQKRYVTNIQNSGRVLLEMINDVLDLAKMESGRMEVRLSDFDLATVVGAQCDMARPLAERKNIDLETRVEGRLPEMYQDQGKIQQILNNLLSNAIKFTPEGGRIVVTTVAKAHGNVLLRVHDTGVGIAPEDQVSIFEKFRQGTDVLPGGDAMTREYSGTGLGLSIVKELCKLLGGEILLESELGKGSTFSVRLPARLADRPRLDSPLVEGVEQLTKPRRFDFTQPLAGAATETPSPAQTR